MVIRKYFYFRKGRLITTVMLINKHWFLSEDRANWTQKVVIVQRSSDRNFHMVIDDILDDPGD